MIYKHLVDVKYFIFLIIIYYLILRFLHLNLQDILLFCNDDFFDSDTAEIYEQISGFYLNTDTMKHFVPYVLLFLLETVRSLLDPGELIITKISIFQLIGAVNVALMFALVKLITLDTKKSFLLALAFACSFSQLTVGSFPETYGASILILLSYLLFYNSSIFNTKQTDVYIRAAGASLLGLSHLPLFIIGLYSKFEHNNSNDTLKSLIVLIIGGLIATSPMWSVSMLSASAFDLIYTYTDRYASFTHLTELDLWATVVANLFIVALISPSEFILNKYTLSDIPILYWLGFLAASLIVLAQWKNYSFSYGKLRWSLVSILLFQVVFYVFFAPEFSALYGVTNIAISIFCISLILKNVRIQKGIYITAYVLLLIIFIFNSLTIHNTPSKPMDGNCYNWGVKTGLYQVF